MRLITALCFALSAIAFMLLYLDLPPFFRRVVPVILAAILCIFSIITLYFYFFLIIWGQESVEAQLSSLAFFLAPAKRMAFLTACNFLLVGCIIYLFSTDRDRSANLAHILVIPVFLISYFVIVSYILEVYSATEVSGISVSLYSGITFCGLAVSALFMKPHTWLLKLLISPDTAGIISRKLLPPLMILPILIGWLRIHGERIALYRSEEGVVLVAIAYAFCFLILIWLTARSIDKIDRKRRSAELALKQSEEKLWSVLNATQESVYMFDRDGKFTMANSTGLRRLKIPTENELLGHHFSEFMPASVAEARQEKFDAVFNTGQPFEFVDERDGRMFSHNFFPVFKDNIVSSVVTYSTDITERKRAEVNLKESEDRFRTIAESLPVLILIYSVTKSTILFVNESFEKKFGYKKNDLMNRKVPAFFINPGENSTLGDELRKQGRVYNKQIKVKKADGSPFWIMTSIKEILFMNEPAYLSAAIDITETKTVQDELLRLNRILDVNSSSSHAMMHCNDEFIFLNKVCRIIIEVCGYKMVWVGYAQDDEHKSVKPVAYYGFDQGYIDQLNVTWNDDKLGKGPTGTAIRTGKPSVCRNMQTDRKFEPWREAAIERGYSSSLVLPLISEKKPFGAISIYSEEPDPFSRSEIKLLTDLAAEMAYGISFIRLTESERASAKAIKESEAKLKELVATKDKFFNIVAHDLKNPFTSLLGSSELLFDNINQMTPENVRELALILNDSAKGGYAILQNLLDWSRSQTGLLKFNLEKVNLKKIIDENIENLQLQVNNKGLKIKSELTKDLHLFSDKNMINTILRNLLSNAVKYTHKNGTVVVRISKTRKNVIVTVRDSGIGIPKEKVATLFRIDNSLSSPGTAKEQGTGLGLKLCKEFTERMGGRIWVDSEEGKGSEFKFSIPLSSNKPEVFQVQG
jgi:PAS domain S-box-containing protein